jgi:ribose-phosphate pyrophosphokinase
MDGEIDIQLLESVRGKELYLIQSTCPPTNDNLMELILMISAAKRASCKSVTAVIPYFGYARQDRKVVPRVPISAADVAKLIETMGVDRVISLDLHCGQIQGFFGPAVPVDNLTTRNVGINYILKENLVENLSNCTIISPDAGGVTRARSFQTGLIRKSGNPNIQLAMLIKRRSKASEIEVMQLVGNVEGKECVIIDDIIDTGGTLIKAAEILMANGAKRVMVYATHGLFSGSAYKKFSDEKNIDTIIVTNSIPLKEGAPSKIKQVSVGVMLGEAIRRIHQKESVSEIL